MKGLINEVWKEEWMKYERKNEWSMKGIINEVWKEGWMNYEMKV